MTAHASDNVDVNLIKVLVVDDDPFIRNIILRLLDKLGVGSVAEAEDGAEGLEKLASVAPDLVVLDIMMENMNGLQFLKALRTGLSGYRRDLPVVVLTGSSEESVMGTALALDCDAFLRKPDGLNDLEGRLVRVLQNPQEVRASSAYRAVAIPDLVDRIPPPPAPDPSPADVAAVAMPVYEVEAGAVLDRDLVSPEGHLLLAAGAVVTEAYIHRLSDISEMIDLPDLWVRPA